MAVSYTHLDVYKRQRPNRIKKESIKKEDPNMANRIPCTPFGKKMKIAMVEQDIPQQELARRLGIANSTVSDIISSCV